MTNGEFLFYGGAALLGLTVILLIIFLIKSLSISRRAAPAGPGELSVCAIPTPPSGN